MMLTKIRRSVNHPIRQLEQIGDLGYFDFLNRLAPAAGARPSGRDQGRLRSSPIAEHSDLPRAARATASPLGRRIAAPDSLRAAVKPKIFPNGCRKLSHARSVPLARAPADTAPTGARHARSRARGAVTGIR